VGSSSHILGHAKSELLGASPSYFNDFADLIGMDLEHYDERDAELEVVPTAFNGGVTDEELCEILHELYSKSRGRLFWVKFLARRVFEGKSDETPTCKAFTPLYVSLSGER
jgi:hypothetical protein